MSLVESEITSRGLSVSAAAALIGVGAPTLQKHLAGEYVRSDSAQKYSDWLSGRSSGRVFALHRPDATRTASADEAADEPLPFAPSAPALVVDIFSGCGGLSLGFDLLGGGRYFRTVLAIDNQEAPIAILNRNAEGHGRERNEVGRRVDLTEFSNEAEFLTFYVGHCARLHGDQRTERLLAGLCNRAFETFCEEVATVDARYLAELTKARASDAWRKELEALDRQSLGQTSVIAFHDRLRLPKPGTKAPVIPSVLWEGTATPTDGCRVAASRSALAAAESEWKAEVDVLRAKQGASGRGQLSASSRRVQSFFSFLTSDAFSPVKAAWKAWRARRLDLREKIFDDPQFSEAITDLYSKSYPVSVLVGGPPCQGFSRIGRGKIRSLREAMVHAHGSDEAGDARNLLFQQYVMVLGALKPSVFLFENVQHFQSTVRADGVAFHATAVLAEAIANMSDGKALYQVSSRTIDASRHGIPQSRQRFFMCGVRTSPLMAEVHAVGQAAACLTLPLQPEVPLSVAIAGLPEPGLVGGVTAGRGAGLDQVLRIDSSSQSQVDAGRFIRWIRQPSPGSQSSPAGVDAHFARAARTDDAALFALMGPGKRWMDYRADDSETVTLLQQLLAGLAALPVSSWDAVRKSASRAGTELPERDQLEELTTKVNGSLSLRLLLEQVGHKLGVPHHLLTETYLAKRDGNHGDWVARMDPARPSKTMVSHMGKDTYSYVHPTMPRTISVRESARIQTFPDWFSFGGVALTDAFRMIGNAVPPLLSHGIAAKVARAVFTGEQSAKFRQTSAHLEGHQVL